jgi:hypothetical protein
MKDATQDIDMLLRNHAKTCENKALQCKQRADAVAQRQVQGDGLQRQRDQEVAQHEQEAADWKARQATAESGFMLVDPSNSKFMLTHGPLINASAAAGRVRFVGSQEGHRAGGTPYQPGTKGTFDSPR